MPEIMLHGCTPEPLMSYLKALGVLRLIAEQADSEARGAWRGGIFVLSSTFDEAALLGFFREDYKPIEGRGFRSSQGCGPIEAVRLALGS
jgi:CRISPR-associated protein Csx17